MNIHTYIDTYIHTYIHTYVLTYTYIHTYEDGHYLEVHLFPISWLPILEYVNEQFDKYLNEEVSINRKKVIPDTRVHCCLYFIPPTGHR